MRFEGVTMPEVSIIIPVYNSENSIGKCISSILNQSFDDFELIIVNDGSTDNSLNICQKYESADDRIRVFNRDNYGVSASRNFGMLKAFGNFIMFCDSDDTVEKDWVEKLYETIKQFPKHLINCGISKVNTGSVNKVTLDRNIPVQEFEKKDYYLLYKIGVSGAVWNKIFSNKIIKEKEILFDENISYAEDVKFCSDYYFYCDKIIMLNYSLYNYYESDAKTSLSKKYYPYLYDMEKLTYEYRKKYISEEYMQLFLKDYLYKFSLCLENTFDKRNNESIFKKIKYNQYILNDASFVEVLKRIVPEKYDEKLVYEFRKGKYIPLYIRRVLKAILKR